jgi:hypothetical protein
MIVAQRSAGRMEFEIKRVKNGWLLKYKDTEDPDATWVQEERWDSEEECFVYFLRTIIENFGPDGGYGKRKARNIIPIIMPGYSYEGKLEPEYIEKLKELRDSLQSILDEQNERKDDTEY